MSSKSPVRSCEDVDETALSYAEIKALCAGNPLIAEKMTLDNEVSKLRMLKAEHKSQHYRLEDNLSTKFPEQITAVSERIAGIEKDIAVYAAEKAKCADVQSGLGGAVSVSSKFPGIKINGTTYTEKEPAGKALLEACKGNGVYGQDGRLTINAAIYRRFFLSESAIRASPATFAILYVALNGQMGGSRLPAISLATLRFFLRLLGIITLRCNTICFRKFA